MKTKISFLAIVLILFAWVCCFSQNEEASLGEEITEEEAGLQKEDYSGQQDLMDTQAQVMKPVFRVKEVGDDLFSIELRDVEIGDLLRVLAHDYKLNIVIDKEASGRVTASFSNITLEEALERIAENNNLAVKKIGNVIKVVPNLVSKTFVLKYMEAKVLMEPNKQDTLATGASGEMQGTYSQASSEASQTPTEPSLQEGGLSSRKANTIYDLLSNKGKLLFNNEANSIIVIDYPDNVERISEFLQKVDIMPRQVLIEARLVEVKLQKEHSLGVNWQLFAEKGGLPLGQFKLYSASAAEGLRQAISYKNTYYPPAQTTTGSESPFTITIFDENINVVLQTLSNSLKTDILSAPRVATVNNREAEIKIIQNLPWAEPEVTVEGDSGSVTVTWTVNFEEVGIILKVTPIINEDGKITMVLNPEVSEKTSDYTLTVTQGSTSVPYTVPIIDKRIASTKVVVGNGQTLIIGGLIKDKVKHGETKVPLLGDIPFLGYLFKSKSEITDKTELLIFVSPIIITEDEFKRMERKEKYDIGKGYMEEREREEQILKMMELQENTKKNNLEVIKEEVE